MAGFLHGVPLLVFVLAFPQWLNRIPLAALAAALLFVGYDLAPLSVFRQMGKRGPDPFIPFIVTVLAILFTDLLWGVGIGMAATVFFILRANLRTPYFLHRREVHREDSPTGSREHIHLELSENMSFLNEASASRTLHSTADGAIVEIDGSRALYIDRDVLEIIYGFREFAHHRGIEVVLVDIPALDAPHAELSARHPVRTDDPSRAGPTERKRWAETRERP